MWVSSKSIHQSKPRLQVTKTRNNINLRIYDLWIYCHSVSELKHERRIMLTIRFSGYAIKTHAFVKQRFNSTINYTNFGINGFLDFVHCPIF
jgi:hypothetical protein